MLAKDPEKRPSIQELTEVPIIRNAIQIFLRDFKFFKKDEALPIADIWIEERMEVEETAKTHQWLSLTHKFGNKTDLLVSDLIIYIPKQLN